MPPPPRTLITGDKGFVGGSALKLISGAIGLSADCPEIDIRNPEQLCHRLEETAPDFVLHLAAQSFIPESFANPEQTFDINFLGTLHILKALEKTGFRGRFLYVSSGDVYGQVAPNELPLSESQPPRPRNPYAVSKVAAEALCFQWSQTAQFEVIIARPFNHIGIGQSSRFAIPEFCQQIAEIKLGLRNGPIITGNIDLTRDFTDVQDIISAYELLLKQGLNGETYNVCSGHECSLRHTIDILQEIAQTRIDVHVDQLRFRPTDLPRVCGSNKKLFDATGWKPTIPFRTTLKKIYTFLESQIEC